MTLGEIWRRAARLVRGSSEDDELREEMQMHTELRERANRAAGMAADDARAAAHRRFGNAVALRERSRDEWGFQWAEHATHDAKFAARRLLQRPGFAVAVIAVLALGIGATTAMFSAVDAAMLRPLPFPQPDRLVSLTRVDVPLDMGQPDGSSVADGPLMINDVSGMHDIFSGVAAYATGGLNLADVERPVRVTAGVVTANFFTVLGVAPLQGRSFTEAEGIPNGPNVVIISYGLWRRQFGATPVLGTAITLNNQAYTIVGIMPRGFGFPKESDLWIPMSVPNTLATFSAFRGFLISTVIARVAPGLRLSVANAQLTARWQQRFLPPVAGERRRPNLDRTVAAIKAKGALTPLRRELAGDRVTAIIVLFGATVLLLLVTCANVTNLLLSQAAARRGEIAVRAVLGASRGRIVRQLLTESVMLASVGTIIGILLAPAALGAMRALMPAELSGVAPATVDVRVLAFAATLALVTGVGFGLWPALGSTREASAETLKTGGRSATRWRAGRARRFLVGTELALTIVLLVGALLMLRSFERLMSVDRGMETERVGTLELSFGAGSGRRDVRLQRIQDIESRLASVPGITGVGAINDLPLGGLGGIAIQVHPDVTQASADDAAGGRYLMASAGYFAAMGIPMKRGRSFTAADDSLAPPVAIISESMARRYWPGVDALGHTFTMFTATPITVVGIVADVRELKLESDPMPQIYLPVTEQTPVNIAIVARSTLAPAALLARMREAVHAADPSQAVFDVKTMDEVVGSSVAPRRTNTLLISAFAAFALILSAVGLYAVVSYGVSQRSREFGIRSALGATGGELIRMVTREMTLVLGAGVVAGVAGAWALSRVLTSLIYGVSVHDPATFLIAPLVMLAPAIAATLLPARRATKVNPAEVMRAD